MGKTTRKPKEKPADARTSAPVPHAPNGNNGSLKELLKELWEAAVKLRGSIEPADYKRYVLPIIFLRFLSLRYDRRRAELEQLIADPTSDYHITNAKAALRILNDADEYASAAEDDAVREEFLTAEQLLSLAFLLVKHIDSCRKHADEVIFYQTVRKQVAKAMPGKKPPKELERAVRDLVDESVESVGVVDIFRAAGIEKADLSILDDRFLQTFKDRPQQDLRLKLLEQLMRDEIHRRQRENLTQAKSFQALLTQTLLNYHNRLIDAAAVIEALIQMRKEINANDERARALNLEPDELAFYDAVATNYASLYEPSVLRDLIHDVVQTVKKNLKVDWNEPHREQVFTTIRAAVRRTLLRHGVQPEHPEPITVRVMEQAAATFANWPALAA